MLKKTQKITYFSLFLIVLVYNPFDGFFYKSGDNNSSSTISHSNIVLQKMNEMTLREKIAQMIVSSVVPEDFSENSKESKRLNALCQNSKIGGFIFFKGSASGYMHVSNFLQSMSETPLLISSDFERGTGMRVTDGTLFPNNMAIGAAGNFELAYQMGKSIAEETRALGVQQNYSPVCDVNNNPDNPIINVRSFGEDPLLVSKMSEAMIKGLQDGKVIATAKHFPGHGDTKIDSHNDLPVLNFDIDRLNQIELVPFKNAIDKNVRSVMIAHLSFPELENKPNVPASLSENIVQGLLIDKLGFKGLVVTDALNMKGITKYFSTSQVAVMCVNAGIDLILMPADEEASITAIENAIGSGAITEERINRSVEKILSAKEWLGLFKNASVDESPLTSKINTSKFNELAQKIADESVTLVKDDNNALPFKKDITHILVYNLSDGRDNINSSYFTSKITDYYPNAEVVDINQEIGANGFSAYVDNAKSYDAVIVSVFAKVKYGTGKISILPSHAELIKSLSQSVKNLVTISLGNPYLLKEFPEASSYICTYGDADVSINAVIKAIKGEIKFQGKLPVTITPDYKFGWSILK
jgi:beta-N-acetylhexosaminidase